MLERAQRRTRGEGGLRIVPLVPTPQLLLTYVLMRWPRLFDSSTTCDLQSPALPAEAVRADRDKEVFEVLRLREPNEMLALDLLSNLFLCHLEDGRGDLALVVGAKHVVQNARGFAR